MDVVTTLTTCIENYFHGVDDGYLPANLCVMGLTLQIHKHAQSCAQTVIPWVRRTIGWHDNTGLDVPVQGAFQVTRTDGAGRKHFLPRDGRGGRPPSGPGRYPTCPEVQGGRDGHCPPPGAQHGQFAHPNKNRGEYRPAVICDACC